MNAWILAVGSEMLTPFRVDTNSLVITERLNAIGCDVRLKVVVGDSVDELARVLTAALDSADLIVCTGGLGPTEDDITRDALTRVLGMPLEIDEAIVEHIRARFARRGITMPDINRRQAMVPRGATVLANPNGTAPGLWIERGNVRIVALPGPPREMRPMLDAVAQERLAPLIGGRGLFRRVIKITGRAESDVDARAQPIYGRWTTQPVPITTTILAVIGQIELHLTAAANSRAEADVALDAAVRELQDAFGSSIYSVDGRPLPRVVGDMLRAAHWTVAVGESCTGGLLASLLTDVPGSSDYVERGAVCYSNRSKVEWLGVSESLIAEHGAVSEPVAQAMAEGIRARAHTDVGIGVTGIAGPGGGTPDKPVGTVAIAVVAGGDTRVRTFQFIGEREQVKYQSAQAAMNMLRIMLLELRNSGTGELRN
jgi:nicotinamide-nucleotide amidase